MSVQQLEQLEQLGYLVIDQFLPDAVLQQIISVFDIYYQANLFERAGIGSGHLHQLDANIRGDEVYWLNENAQKEEGIADFFEQLNSLQEAFRNYFRISIQGYEFHFALYPVGRYYEKHLDQFSERSNRLFSVILYLNQNWNPQDGGMLRLHLADQIIDIAPEWGRLVVMQSHLVEHEVMKSFAPRKSMTGWMLRRKPGLSFLED